MWSVIVMVKNEENKRINLNCCFRERYLETAGNCYIDSFFAFLTINTVSLVINMILQWIIYSLEVMHLWLAIELSWLIFNCIITMFFVDDIAKSISYLTLCIWPGMQLQVQGLMVFSSSAEGGMQIVWWVKQCNFLGCLFLWRMNVMVS